MSDEHEDRLDRIERILDQSSALNRADAQDRAQRAEQRAAQQRAAEQRAWKISEEETKLRHKKLLSDIAALVHTMREEIRNNPRDGGAN